MFEAYKQGFDSSIATTFNIFPQLGVKIHENTLNGKELEAKSLQEKLTNAVECISKYGKLMCKLFDIRMFNLYYN